MNFKLEKSSLIALALLGLTCTLITIFLPEIWYDLWRMVKFAIHYFSIVVFFISIGFVIYINNERKKHKEAEKGEAKTIVIPQTVIEKIKMTLADSVIAWVVIGVIAFLLFTITKEAPVPGFRDANGNKIEQTIVRD